MSDTTLKFGPEWLRALTEPQPGTVNYTPPLPNMKLAEYRYGREEMLALFDKDVHPSLELLSLGALLVEKCQFPLNLIQMGEDETRAWQRGANSDASLRPFGSQGKRPPSPVRGRGRGRGGSAYPHYERNRNTEENLEGGRVRIDRDDRSFPHGRGRIGGFDRQINERGWLDSTDKPLKDEDKDNTSPRKGYTRAPAEDWRGGRAGDNSKIKEEGWRSVSSSRVWNNGPGSALVQSWRIGDRPKLDVGKNLDRWKKDDEKFQSSSRSVYSKKKQDSDNLPEWAVHDSAEEARGSFDDSGKFKAEELHSYQTFMQSDKWGEEERWDDEEIDPECSQIGKDCIVEQTNTLNDQANEKTEDGISGSQKSDDMEILAGSLVASLVEEVESKNGIAMNLQVSAKIGIDVLGETTWTYLDPQGQVQGPFKSEEMLEWCNAGYFPHDLMVQRNVDSKFTPLAELSKLYGKNPFTPGPTPPPIDSIVEDQIQQQQLLQLHQLYLQQQHILAQQQMLLMQQQGPDLSKIIFPNSSNNLGSKCIPETRRPDFISGYENDPIGHFLGNLNKPQSDQISMDQILRSPVDMSGYNDARLDNFICKNPESVSPSADEDVNLKVRFGSNEDETELVKDFDPIRSLLNQLQQTSMLAEENGIGNSKDLQSNSDFGPEICDEDQAKQKEYSTSDQVVKYSNCNMLSSLSPLVENIGSSDAVDKIINTQFQVPKSTEKKEKKSRRAEEKRKLKESKATNGQATGLSYIPGMNISVEHQEQQVIQTCQPKDDGRQFDSITKPDAQLFEQPRQEPKVRELEVQLSSRPAPWARTEVPVIDKLEIGLTLQEIQKLEVEKERLEKAAREFAEAELKDEMRRQEDEDKVKRSKQTNWAASTFHVSSQVKSLADIQAEEARVEKAQQEKEDKKRGKESISKSSLKTTISWAGKIAASAPNKAKTTHPPSSITADSVNVVAPDGFWEPLVANKQHQNKSQTGPGSKQKNNKQSNVVKDAINEFDDWCRKALEGLSAQVDIPTFLAFLRDVESPYEVHDYIKSYVGDGKVQKKFAMEYLEKRSRWKNAKRVGNRYEDDLTTPAQALFPGEGDFQEANRKGKKKVKTSKSNLNHLLGFSVQGQGVNRGELDLPQ